MGVLPEIPFMKQKIVLIIAILMGLLAFVLTHSYLKAERAKLLRGYQKIIVLVAKVDLPAGTLLTLEDLAKKSVFQSAVGGNIFLTEDLARLENKKLLYPLKRGEPVWWSHVDLPRGNRRGLAPKIRIGMRAISISVSGENAVSGLVQPNDRVDILGTFTMPSREVAGEEETVTFTLLQDVSVLATGDQLANEDFGSTRGSRARGYSTVTLELTMEEAEVLVFAQTVKGALTLSLRNPEDVLFKENLPEINFKEMQSRLETLNIDRQRFVRKKTINSSR
jgi:pilus assembly protein CpaB